jgi:hypothetical protein
MRNPWYLTRGNRVVRKAPPDSEPGTESVNRSDVLIIEPGSAERALLARFLGYRELFYVLAWRDVSVRYKADYHRLGLGAGPAVSLPMYCFAGLLP